MQARSGWSGFLRAARRRCLRLIRNLRYLAYLVAAATSRRQRTAVKLNGRTILITGASTGIGLASNRCASSLKVRASTVIELMPPAVKTDMAEEEGVKIIRPGQANQLAFMRRAAPDFINKQLWKGSKTMVPTA
jgi:hypothetical protein